MIKTYEGLMIIMTRRNKREKSARKYFKQAKKECSKCLVKWQDNLDKREACERYIIQTWQTIDNMKRNEIQITDAFLKAALEEVEEMYQKAQKEEELYKDLFQHWFLLVNIWKRTIDSCGY